MNRHIRVFLSTLVATLSAAGAAQASQGTSPTPGGDVLAWAQFGVLGLVVVGFLMGWIVPGPIYNRERDRADKLQDLALSGTGLADRATGVTAGVIEDRRRIERLEAEVTAALGKRTPTRKRGS